MAEYYDYITTQGVIVPDTSKVLSDIQDEFKQLFGDNLDVTPETPQGRLIELMARNRSFTIQICAAVSNMLNLGKANGFVLNDLGSLFLISRQPATYTTTTVILTGKSGTTIPAGTRLQTESGDIFVNDSAYTIPSSGSIQALYRAEEAGPVPAKANTLNIILDEVTGLETANNPAAPTLGREQESDNAFRNRIRYSLNTNSIAVISSIKAALENITGVSGSYCYDNYSDVGVIVDGVTVPAHSILAVVDGGEKQEIANVLYEKKTIGTGYVKSTDNPDYTIESATVIDDAYGTVYEVRFMRPILTDVDIKITVSRKNYTGDSLETEIKSAILDFAAGNNPEVGGVVIGGSLSPFEISAAVSSEIPTIFINNCLIGMHGGTLSAQTMTFGEIHKANITAENITVTITD